MTAQEFATRVRMSEDILGHITYTYHNKVAMNRRCAYQLLGRLHTELTSEQIDEVLCIVLHATPMSPAKLINTQTRFEARCQIDGDTAEIKRAVFDAFGLESERKPLLTRKQVMEVIRTCDKLVNNETGIEAVHKGRKQPGTIRRHMFIHLLYKELRYDSVEKVSDLVGKALLGVGLDHSTGLHACRQCRNYIDTNYQPFLRMYDPAKRFMFQAFGR